MSPRPGVEITSSGAPRPSGLDSDTGKWFVLGPAQKGSVLKPGLVRNMDEFQQQYGGRVASSLLWDSLETYFREGGVEAYVMRVIGASAAIAGHTFNDSQGSPAPSIRIDAGNPGTWGNNLSVTITAGSGTVSVAVNDSVLGLVDSSGTLTSQADAVAWGNKSSWVNVSIPNGAGTNLPAAASAVALSGGLDDYTGVNDTVRTSALALITRDLGPGQVSAPGVLTSNTRQALLAHAEANNREAILDGTNTATASALISEGNALQGNEYGALFAPWVVVPGLLGAGNTVRTVPPCALVAGLIARNDGVASPNTPAAGAAGVARFALDVAQPGWSDSDRQLLNEAGVDVILSGNGAPKLYGYRTLADPDVDATWLGLGNQRLRLQIVAEAEAIAEQYLFKQIDGKGEVITAFQSSLKGMLEGHRRDGSLYGDTAAEAYTVDVGSSVNTPTTLANNELHAVISLRMSPFAELVQIEIVKVAVTQSL